MKENAKRERTYPSERVCSLGKQPLILSVEHEFGGWAVDIRKNKPGEITDFVVDYVRAYQYKELL